LRSKSRRNKAQFSIIAALLITIIMVSAVIMTYATIRNLPFQESLKVLSSIEEMNTSLRKLLEFASGYYGSILQVTGNVTYAQELTSSYIQSGFVYIAHSHPQWNPLFDVNYVTFSTRWYEPTSYSIGNLSITYTIPGVGVSQITYATSIALQAKILETAAGKSKVVVTREEGKPDLTLGKENFLFYKYSNQSWETLQPVTEPMIFSNGTYVISIPSGVDQSSYLMKVSDDKGIGATAFFSNSGKPQYTYTFSWDAGLYSSLARDTVVVEALQNGTLRWLGQNIQLSTTGHPLPPIPVRALRVNQTINGVNRAVPFQVEDWGSSYKVPLGLTSNASLFGDRQMVVFLVNHNVQKTTIWWDGRDTARQTSKAYTNLYFTGDNPSSGTLTNGILTLSIGGDFTITSSVSGGTITSTASFMRINNDDPTYGAGQAYVIHHGIVRDIVQQEAEWGGGIPNSPNVYSQIVLTLPANATYYTYALRTIFVNSAQSRTLSDLSPLQVTSGWITALRSLTENATSGGLPIVGETLGGQSRLFYNFSSPSTGWAHHWSEYISGSGGAGIMFNDNSNFRLYRFDSISGQKTGAISVTNEQSTSWQTPNSVYSRCGETSPYVASRAIDGNTFGDSYWRHSTTENHWIILDMGQITQISQIQIYQSSTASERWGQSSGIEVYVSNSTGSWGSAVWIGTLDASGWRQTGSFTAIGRYIRLYSRSTSSSQRLYEVQVQTAQRRVTVEVNPVERYSASFTYPLDVTWHGAIVTFTTEPIYPTSGYIGLWVIVKYPPTVAVE
jgi:hypothetical protein